MYWCRDCYFEFDEPEPSTASDGLRGWDGPYYVECCPRCGSEHFDELYHSGECVKGVC